MPRPKVRPEDRQRSLKAYLPCQASKIRCDSQLPCVSCIRRDRASMCSYIEAPRRRHHISHSHESRRSRNRPDPPQAVRAEPVPSANESSTQHASTSRSHPSNEADFIRSPESTESRMLLSSKGERVYIGESSSLSFLHFLRGIMKQYMGPSPFTENGRMNIMLEADMNDDQTGIFEEDLEQKRGLIQSYFEASSAILDLCTEDEMLDLLQSEYCRRGNGTTSFKQDDFAALYLVIAIGGQCRGSSQFDLQYAARYFARGQQAAFEGMLKDPSLSMVKIFLLMAFYMLGACRRNAAFMYLGVASKAAVALGLHIAGQYRGLSKDEYNVRIRTWKSLRVLDLLVSSLLGRPVGSLALDPSNATLNENNTGNNIRRLAITAALDGCGLLDGIIQGLRKEENNIDTATAEHFLQRLRHWTQRLPRELRQFTKHDDTLIDSTDRELVIGNVHIACVYYFSVIMLTRPFLISYLMSRLRGVSKVTIDAAAESSSKCFKMAQVCISSATYMAQICHKAMVSDFLLNNMCMMKALVFGAGLILSFSLFVQDDVAHHDTEGAFQSACYVLQRISDVSPRAKHYHEILKSFAEAIIKHRQQIALDRQRTMNQYVDQVLTIDIDIDINNVANSNGNSHRPQHSTAFSGDNTVMMASKFQQPEKYLSDSIPPTPSTSTINTIANSYDQGGTAFSTMTSIPSPLNDTTSTMGTIDLDVGVDVDLDGFPILSSHNADGNCSYSNYLSIDYEPFGLLFEGM